jgi:nucleoside-diphosphate-sugar epimerase
MSKILFLGATGYLGGTVLSQLLASTKPSITNITFDVLVREKTQVLNLKNAYGFRITTVEWSGLEDTTFIEDTASRYDIVVNAGCGFIPQEAIAIVKGLSRRVETGPPPCLLHLSGCTNLAEECPSREWSDEKDQVEVIECMKTLEKEERYLQRTAELGVVETAAAAGVRAISVNAPCIFGKGTGLFRNQELVIPSIMEYIKRHGHGVKLNDTANFDWVHVVDLANLFVLLVRATLERGDRGFVCLPLATSGIMFTAVGRTLITDIHQKCLDVLFEKSILPRDGTPKEKEIRLVSLQEMADVLTAGRVDVAKRGWGGHKSTKADLARKYLGWEPTRLEHDWNRAFYDALAFLSYNNMEIDTMKSCIGLK